MKKELDTVFETPMMRQYQEIKKNHPGTVLFFRMGDFYEMFFEDAKVASSILQIALTERQKGVPMAGIPFHALDNYLYKLVDSGLKVAICEQLETKPPKGEKIVKREVTRIVTPGTHIRDGLTANFLISLYVNNREISAVSCDFGTGESHLIVKSLPKGKGAYPELEGFIRFLTSHYGRGEFLLHGNFFLEEIKFLLQQENSMVNIPDESLGLSSWIYDKSYCEKIIKEFFDLISVESALGKVSREFPTAVVSLGALLHYLKETQKEFLSHLKIPRYMPEKDIMYLDENAVRSLELLSNQNDGTVRGSLFHVLDKNKTVLGRRRLRHSILGPLIQSSDIDKRLDCVSLFVDNSALREKFQESLGSLGDLEKILSKICSARNTPRDLGFLRDSLRIGLAILAIVEKVPNKNIFLFLPDDESINKTGEIFTYLDKLLLDKLPINRELAIIRDGYSERVDHYRFLTQSGKEWIGRFQEEQRRKTGIQTLKVKYNRVFGYFIEVSKGQSAQVPKEYLRKQTLVNAERFTTDELKNYEVELLVAEDKLKEEESKIYQEAIQNTIRETLSIQKLANFLGYLDMFCGLAEKALSRDYCRPDIKNSNLLRIINGRHPVVEEYIDEGNFVPNDLILDNNENAIAIITGPNMAGKSTYIRQIALISLMAQIGSFVPAEEAVIGITDRIFTRIGSGDNLARGQSTFLMEMQETANIMNHITDQSLVIFDEIGRGTSTYDGMAIAWSLIEYLSSLDDKIPRILFATHYHELTNLSRKKGVFNLTLLVEEKANSVNFLRKVVSGATDRSYGVYVAKLAGLSPGIVRRAHVILKILENAGKENKQLDFFDKIPLESEGLKTGEPQLDPPLAFSGDYQETDKMANLKFFLKALEEINPDELSPREALEILFEWKKNFG